jgi:signal transduction histidine kinase
VTVRVKLALLYGLLFLIVGAGLVAVSYQLVRSNLPADKATQASGSDVILRAEKLAKTPNLSAGERAALDKLAATPADQAFFAVQKGGGLDLSPDIIRQLTASLPVTVRNDALHQLLVQSAIALGITTIIAIALGWIVAGRVLRPLTRITDTAQRLSASNLEERINLSGPDDELSRLANTFDAMLDRIAASFEGQRRFVANASHELRTPLTIMATELDVTLARPDATIDELREMGTTVRSAVDRSDRLITSLLALARVEEGLEVTTATDLAAIVTDTLARRADEITILDLHVATVLDPTVVVGDPGLLDRLVDNLVENAIRHNIDGGWIHIETHATDTGHQLEVASSGGLVPDDQADELFTPFRRLDGRTGGHRNMGLGLSIVRAIAHAHGGTASAAPIPGGGLRVTVRFDTSTAAQPTAMEGAPLGPASRDDNPTI